MQISYTALAGQADFVCPGGAAPSAVTVNAVTAVFTGRPGGFTIDAGDLPTAGQLVVATFDDPVGYVSLDTVNDAVADLSADVAAMQTDVDLIVTQTAV